MGRKRPSGLVAHNTESKGIEMSATDQIAKIGNILGYDFSPYTLSEIKDALMDGEFLGQINATLESVEEAWDIANNAQEEQCPLYDYYEAKSEGRL